MIKLCGNAFEPCEQGEFLRDRAFTGAVNCASPDGEGRHRGAVVGDIGNTDEALIVLCGGASADFRYSSGLDKAVLSPDDAFAGSVRGGIPWAGGFFHGGEAEKAVVDFALVGKADARTGLEQLCGRKGGERVLHFPCGARAKS